MTKRFPTAGQAIGGLYVWDRGSQAEGESSAGRHVQRWHVRPGYADQKEVLPTEHAVIGDELRQVAVWCELGMCIARYADPGALGHADIVARARAAGWCKDGFGRLICPPCQQRFAIWSSAPVVPRMRWGQLGAPERRYVGQHRVRGGPAGRLGGGLRTADRKPKG